MVFKGGRSHRMAAWTHIRERENEGRTEDGGVVFPEGLKIRTGRKTNYPLWKFPEVYRICVFHHTTIKCQPQQKEDTNS